LHSLLLLLLKLARARYVMNAGKSASLAPPATTSSKNAWTDATPTSDAILRLKLPNPPVRCIQNGQQRLKRGSRRVHVVAAIHCTLCSQSMFDLSLNVD
ncbi:hypothetical protein CI238_12212, partial [Colletotrichum incanum]